MRSLSASPGLPPVSLHTNPHVAPYPLAGIPIFVTYIRMMDDENRDDILPEDALGEEFEEEFEEDEKY